MHPLGPFIEFSRYSTTKGCRNCKRINWRIFTPFLRPLPIFAFFSATSSKSRHWSASTYTATRDAPTSSCSETTRKKVGAKPIIPRNTTTSLWSYPKSWNRCEIINPYVFFFFQTSQAFSLKDCRFGITKAKEPSARVVLWRQFKLERAYTMESTYCGFSSGEYTGNQVRWLHFYWLLFDLSD